jgi:hypothetical protein
MPAATAFLIHRTRCEELSRLRHGENRDRIVDLAGFVDLFCVFCGIALAPTTLGRLFRKKARI